MSPETKKCSLCCEIKSINEFTKNGKYFNSKCNPCQLDYLRNWSSSNREKLRCKSRAWYSCNSDKKRKSNKEIYKENIEKYKAKNRSYVESLSPGYIAAMLGAHLNECPAEIIELKRQQLQIHRLSKEFKQTVKEVFK